MKWLGFAFLACYIVGIGVSSFLQKFGMKYLSPYQINFLTVDNDQMTKGKLEPGLFSSS